jgi:ribosomal protein L37AE/L43A
MMSAVNRKILSKKKQRHMGHCSMCGKKLKFARTSENPLSCWQCMIVNADS